MARKPKFTLYAIPATTIEAMRVEEVLDMLRYDGATVQSNPPDGHYLFRIDDPFRQPNVARWASFGVKDVFVVDPDMPRVIERPYHLIAGRAW